MRRHTWGVGVKDVVQVWICPHSPLHPLFYHSMLFLIVGLQLGNVFLKFRHHPHVVSQIDQKLRPARDKKEAMKDGTLKKIYAFIFLAWLEAMWWRHRARSCRETIGKSFFEGGWFSGKLAGRRWFVANIWPPLLSSWHPTRRQLGHKRSGQSIQFYSVSFLQSTIIVLNVFLY